MWRQKLENEKKIEIVHKENKGSFLQENTSEDKNVIQYVLTN